MDETNDNTRESAAMGRYDGYETLRIAEDDGVLTVRLSRPHARNAVDGQLHSELARLFAELRTDPEPRAIVLTGDGGAFSAGGDIEWVAGITPAELDRLFREGRTIVMDLLDVAQPIVAAVDGPAVGFGATLALFCDVVIAGEGARFGDPHVTIGVGAGDGGAIIWPALIGMNRAKELLMTGEIVSASEAYRLGLVNRLVPDEEVLETATALARRLADGSAKAIQATKLSMNALLRDACNVAFDLSLALEKACFTSEDHRRRVARWAGQSTS